MPLNAPKLSAKQLKAIALLSAGAYTINEVADACRVNESTIDRWLKKEEFKSALDEASYETAKELHLAELEKFRLRMKKSGDNLLKLSEVLQEKIIEWVEEADLKKISASHVIRLMSETRGLLDSGSDLLSITLGIDRLLEDLAERSNNE